MFYQLFILLFLSFPLFSEAFFSPPEGWQLIPKEEYPPFVELIYKGSSQKYWYPPSVNLACEEWKGTLDEYIAAISTAHNNHPLISFREIGPYQTDLGCNGRLCFARQRTEYGPVKLIQWVTLKEQTIFVITAAARVEDFSKNYKSFIKVFNSFRFKEPGTPSKT